MIFSTLMWPDPIFWSFFTTDRKINISFIRPNRASHIRQRRLQATNYSRLRHDVLLLVSFPQGASSTQERLSRRKKAEELKNVQCNRKRSLRFCAILNLLQQQESWFSSLFAERGVCDQTKVAIYVLLYNNYILYIYKDVIFLQMDFALC